MTMLPWRTNRSGIGKTDPVRAPRLASGFPVRGPGTRRVVLLVTLLSVLALLAPASPAPAQERDGNADERLRFAGETDVSWLLVPVVVRSPRGWVDDLEEKNFRLFVDGDLVEVDGVDRGADAPLSVIFLQDLSGSMANMDKLDLSRRALDGFVEALETSPRAGAPVGGDLEDELALASFAGGRLAVDVPFTDNQAVLREAAGLWEGWGTTTLHDAVAWLPEISQSGRWGSRVAVLVTDGQDNASAMAPEAARDLVRRARLPVYVLGLRVDAAREAPEAGDTVRYGDLLETLARSTGGAYHEVSSAEEVGAAVEGILDQLRRRYILAVATEGHAPRTWHRLRVEVLPRRDWTITHRAGYVGTPPVD